jgi:uroporphyrinogen decarboxylase
MTARERYLATMTFGQPDRIPFEPGGPRESTLAAWREQGLPEGVSWHAALMDLLGISREGARSVELDLQPDLRMRPWFEEKVLAHERGHCIVQDWMGAIVEISDRYDFSYLRSARDFVTRKWHRFPVQNRDDWARMRERYDPHDPGRQPEELEAKGLALRDRETVCTLTVNGPFWQLREWCGFEGLCTLMADDPDFVQEMAEYWTEFVSVALAPLLRHVRLDAITVSEDMAYKEHSMISPAMVRRFLLPAYQRWVPEIKASGCPIVEMDCDGYVGGLIVTWIEAGINSCWPVEVAAGNDIVEYRRRYGRRMAFGGGIDKRAIAAGGETMRAEVMRVVPPLLEEGGFIPGCDHGVPPDVSWPDFVAYCRLLAELTGWL